jgi:peptidyl-prolyl cis-trans isomerase D
MELFRKLSGNIFFKIILAFVALTFILFGVSSFILGSPNSWVLKVGSTSVSYNAFNKAMQADREVIMSSAKSEEAMKYLESQQFKSDVLGRIVNRVMIEKLYKEFGVEASRNLILQNIAKDPSFRNAEGKFDREIFKKFLAKNGLNEERYVSEIANDITATMVIQTMSMAAPTNFGFTLETENFKQEKRLADVVTISIKDVSDSTKSSEEDLKKFFDENRKMYVLPEMRKVSYLTFSKKDFASDMQISESEIAAEYEKNKDQLQRPETRDFLHIVFEKEEGAKDFAKKLSDEGKGDKTKTKEAFLKLAKQLQNKDQKAVTLAKISQRDFIPELTETIFKLPANSTSEVLQSPLGYHVFFVSAINPATPMSFAEVKNSLKQKMLEGREEKVLQTKINEIDDSLLTSNSLAETAKKFGLKMSSKVVRIDQAGQNENGEQVSEIKDLSNFSQNAFSLKQGQTSKIFYAKNSDGFYALKVEEIEAAHEREFAQVKQQVANDLAKKNKNNALQNLARKVGEEIKTNPASAAQIAAKYKLKFEKNREFPRIYFINFQGRQMPYQNKFLDELFDAKIGEATPVLPGGSQEFVVGVLREIKKAQITSGEFEKAQKQALEGFRVEVLQEFNRFLLKKNPVKVNEKILGKPAGEAE